MDDLDSDLMNEDVILIVLKILWEVASRFTDKEEQLNALDWIHSHYGSSGLAPRLYGHRAIKSNSIQVWVDAELTSLGNKVSIDERKGTRVLGDSLETITKQAARMIFPAVIICPYDLLSKLISIGALDESRSWLLLMACRRFASLVSLKPMDSDKRAPVHGHVTELQRHLRELLCNSASISATERESLSQCIYKLCGLQGEGKSISDGIAEYMTKPIISPSDMLLSVSLSALSSNSSHGETVSLTIKSLLHACSEDELAHLFEMERVKDVQVGYCDYDVAHPEDPWILQFLSQCFIYLEFDSRYAYYAMEKSAKKENSFYTAYQFYERPALCHISDIVRWVCTLLFKQNESIAHHIFSILEYRGFPWCRLYFGIEFSDYEANYILKTNPKPGTESKHVFGIEHTLLHQALELAALGSIQPSIFKEIVAEEELGKLRVDMSKSLTCLLYISTKHELYNIMTCIELIMSEILFSQQFDDDSHRTIIEEGIMDEHFASTSCKAMSVEFGIRCIISGCKAQSESAKEVHRWTGILSDFCTYCVDMISTTEDRMAADHRILNNIMLSLRVFSELITCYNAICTIVPSSGLEGSISFFARALVTGITKSGQVGDSTTSSLFPKLLKQRAWNICQGIENIELRTALSAIFVS